MLPSSSLSRRAVLRGLAASAQALTVGGCASMAATAIAPSPDVSEIATTRTLLVATTRKPANGARSAPWFGPERSPTLTVARVRLTPPDGGRFSLAAVGLVDWRLDAVEPAPGGDLIGQSTSGRDVLLYVHGYNQTFESAVLDAARLSDGIGFGGATMVFAWPSRGRLLDYGYDRESAMWSRDALAGVLDQLIASPTVGRVNIVAHSIGTMLTMEALREHHARHGDTAADRIGAVVFASPDIDMDVFTSSVARIGPLADRITVVTSTNDRALAVSRWIAGGVSRVGAAEAAQLEKLGLRVIDASQQGWGIINHDLYLSNSGIRQVIRGAIAGQPRTFAPGAVQAGGDLFPSADAPRMDAN